MPGMQLSWVLLRAEQSLAGRPPGSIFDSLGIVVKVIFHKRALSRGLSTVVLFTWPWKQSLSSAEIALKPITNCMQRPFPFLEGLIYVKTRRHKCTLLKMISLWLIIPGYHRGLKLTKRTWQYFKDHHTIIYEQISDNKYRCFLWSTFIFLNTKWCLRMEWQINFYGLTSSL